MNKIMKAMDNHSGIIMVGITTITCGVVTILYKRFLDKISDAYESGVDSLMEEES